MNQLPKSYNEKNFLSPGDIHSMAGYHAKLYPIDKTGVTSYQFRIADCYHTISLQGTLTSDDEFNKAITQISNLEQALNKFKHHLITEKNSLYNTPHCFGEFIEGECQSNLCHHFYQCKKL